MNSEDAHDREPGPSCPPPLPVSVLPDETGQSRGWFSQGYLPHFDHPGLVQAITFRLDDSLTSHVLAAWENELHSLPETAQTIEKRKRMAAYLDAGHGSCWLRRSEIAGIVEEALQFFDGERYRLIAWVIMPNHVHVIIEMKPGTFTGGILHSWKSFSARQANKTTRSNRGPSGTGNIRPVYSRRRASSQRRSICGVQSGERRHVQVA